MSTPNSESETFQQRNQSANRDPLTGEPGSHPVGTGAGAVAGGAAAGAAVGTVAGPIGTGIGAAVGAVAGGLAGKATAEHFNPTEGGDLSRFIDYTVIDQSGDKVGSVDAVWEDHTGEPAYLAVRTGWLGLGKAHVVPAYLASVNQSKKTIRLPVEGSVVKNAPSFDSQDDLTNDSEFTISSYYGSSQPRETESIATATIPSTPVKTSTDETCVQLKSEEIKVGKREVEYGGVRLRKIVRTEIVNQPVELSREEIVIERVPVSDQTGVTDLSFEDEELYIPLRREEAVIEKSVRATEEVRVSKRTESERQNVQETIRHEDVEIESDGDKVPDHKS